MTTAQHQRFWEKSFAAQDFGAEAKRLQEGTMAWQLPRCFAHLVSDEMMHTFVVTGTPDEVARKIEPMWESADLLCLIQPLFRIVPERVEPFYHYCQDVPTPENRREVPTTLAMHSSATSPRQRSPRQAEEPDPLLSQPTL